MLKATTTDNFGRESHPVDLEINESGYVLLQDDPDAIQWNLYAPFWEEKETGPFYLMKTISRRRAKECRRTVTAEYRNNDLLCKLLPDNQKMTFEFPMPTDGQEYWALHFGSFSRNYTRPAAMLVYC